MNDNPAEKKKKKKKRQEWSLPEVGCRAVVAPLLLSANDPAAKPKQRRVQISKVRRRLCGNKETLSAGGEEAVGQWVGWSVGRSVKLESNVRLLDQFLGDVEKYEQVTQCVKANQPLHLQESRRNTLKLIHSQFYNPIAAY